METVEERTKREFGTSNMVRTLDVYPALAKLQYEMIKIKRIIRNAKAHNVSQKLIDDLEKKLTELDNGFEKIKDAALFLIKHGGCQKVNPAATSARLDNLLYSQNGAANRPTTQGET